MSNQDEEKVTLTSEQLLSLKLAAETLRGRRAEAELSAMRARDAEKEANDVFAKLNAELACGGEYEVVTSNGMLEVDQENRVRRRLTEFGIAKREAQKNGGSAIKPPSGDASVVQNGVQPHPPSETT